MYDGTLTSGAVSGRPLLGIITYSHHIITRALLALAVAGLQFMQPLNAGSPVVELHVTVSS